MMYRDMHMLSDDVANTTYKKIEISNSLKASCLNLNANFHTTDSSHYFFLKMLNKKPENVIYMHPDLVAALKTNDYSKIENTIVDLKSKNIIYYFGFHPEGKLVDNYDIAKSWKVLKEEPYSIPEKSVDFDALHLTLLESSLALAKEDNNIQLLELVLKHNAYDSVCINNKAILHVTSAICKADADVALFSRFQFTSQPEKSITLTILILKKILSNLHKASKQRLLNDVIRYHKLIEYVLNTLNKASNISSKKLNESVRDCVIFAIKHRIPNIICAFYEKLVTSDSDPSDPADSDSDDDSDDDDDNHISKCESWIIESIMFIISKNKRYIECLTLLKDRIVPNHELVVGWFQKYFYVPSIKIVNAVCDFCPDLKWSLNSKGHRELYPLTHKDRMYRHCMLENKDILLKNQKILLQNQKIQLDTFIVCARMYRNQIPPSVNIQYHNELYAKISKYQKCLQELETSTC